MSRSCLHRAGIYSLAIVLTWFHADPAWAQNSVSPAEGARPAPPLDQLSLPQLLQEVLRSNPELHSASARLAAAGLRPDRADSLPDPTLSLVYRNVGFPEFTLGDEMMSVLGVRFTQALPASGQRPARRAVAEQGVEVAAARREALRRRLLQEATSTYYELGHVCESIEVVNETRGLLVDLYETAENRYAVGEGIQQDVLKGQVEISVLLNRLVQLDQQRATLEAALNRLRGRAASTPIGLPAPTALELESLPLQEIADQAQAGSALLMARRQRIEEQQAAVDLARTGRRPDWMLSGAYMNRGGLTGIWEVNVGITLPIRKGSNQDLEIAENTEELQARRAEHVDASQAIDQLVYDSYLRADRAVRLTRLYEDAIIPQAVLSLESALAGYGVGKVDFLTVIDAVVTLLTYRLEISREYADYARAVARIEEHLGRSLGATPDGIWQPAQDATPSPGRADLPPAELPGGNR